MNVPSANEASGFAGAATGVPVGDGVAAGVACCAVTGVAHAAVGVGDRTAVGEEVRGDGGAICVGVAPGVGAAVGDRAALGRAVGDGASEGAAAPGVSITATGVSLGSAGGSSVPRQPTRSSATIAAVDARAIMLRTHRLHR